METIFLLIWKMRQDIEFQKSRANLQALLNQKGAEQKHIEDAFKDLRGAFFPFEKNQRRQEVAQQRQTLLRFVQQGPIEFTPMSNPDHHKTANRLARGQQRLQRQIKRPAIDLSGVRTISPPTGPRRRTS